MDRLAQFRASTMPAVVVFLALILLGIPAALHAENLMVYIETWGPTELEHIEDEETYLKVQYFLSAVEAGIMEVFFEAEYVVFNAGPISGVEEDVRRSEAHVLKVARDGGADLLMRLSVRFDSVADGAPKPDLGELVYYRVDSEDTMLTERLQLADLTAERTKLSGKAGFEIGTAIARRVLDNS